MIWPRVLSRIASGLRECSVQSLAGIMPVVAVLLGWTLGLFVARRSGTLVGSSRMA